ncbi:MAG: FAD/NAD(P)-binding protein [Sphingomicrobium sp.]
MKSDRGLPVAIIGGGFSGTMLAAQLARRGIASVLIDGSGRMGRGVAYSTTEGAHLLNVRTEEMSAWSGESEHFARSFAPGDHDPRGFAERRQFGRYLGTILDEAVASGKATPVQASAIGAARSGPGWRVDLDTGESVEAAAVALALGNQQPEALRALAGAGPRFIADPWAADSRAAVADLARTGEAALLVGTGLTMVDLVLSLNSAGHRGHIVALSRRGLVPRSHADVDPAPVEREAIPFGNLRGLVRWIRLTSAQVGWRAAIDSLRPHSQPLWQSLGNDQQRRFLRHARPWWDVHRHRIAPEVGHLIAQLVGEGRLQIIAGRITGASASGLGLDIAFQRRGEGTVRTESFAYAFNCTGPLHLIARTRDRLLRSLLDSGEIRPDGLGIGLDVDGQARAGARLWALGPLTKGRYWEIVAVPDIREQAAAVAKDIETELGR